MEIKVTVENLLQRFHGHTVQIKTPGITVVGRLNYQPKSTELVTGRMAQSCVDFVAKEGGGMACVQFTLEEVINIEINAKEDNDAPPTIWLKYE